MKWFLTSGKWFIALIASVWSTLFVGYVLPTPVTYINMGIVIASMTIFFVHKGHVVWFMCLYFFLLELLYPMMPFGSMLFAGGVSVLAMYWWNRFMFVHRSVYTGTMIALFGLTVYRVCAVLFVYMGAVYMHGLEQHNLFSLHTYVLELSTTTLATGFMLMLLRTIHERSS